MRKKFVTNLALLLFLNLLIKPIYVFGIDLNIQNEVGSGSYGIYFSLFSFTLWFNILLDLGFENFNRRKIARSSSSLDNLFSNIFVIKLLLGLLYFIFCAFLGWIFGYTWTEFKLLLVLLFNQFLASFILYLRSNLGGLHLFKTDSFISILDRTILIIVCGTLLWGKFTNQEFKIVWFAFAQTFAYSLTAIITLFILLKRIRQFRPRLELKYSISIIRHSLPFALLILLMATYTRMDSILLERLLPDGKEQAGIYAHSYRILDILSNYGYLFALLLLPIFSRMIKKNEKVDSLVNLSFLLIIIPSIIVAISALFFRSEIISLLYKEHLEESSRVFGLLIFSFISICANYIFGTLLTANGNLRQLNILAGIGVVINLSLNLLLIPKLQALGSAIANVTTQTFMAVTQIILATRTFKFKVNYPLIGKLMFFTLMMFIIGSYSGVTDISWIFELIIFVFIGLILCLSIGLLKIKGLINILKYEDQL